MKTKTSDFLREIGEQPDALLAVVKHYRTDGVSALKQWTTMARKAKRVVFVGMGTSELAPEMVLADLARNGMDASILDAGELLHYPRPISGLPILISQSGESVETRKIAERLAPQKFVAITNNSDSSIARSANLVLPMCAGREVSISTKTYTNTMALLFLMTHALRGKTALEGTLAKLERVAQKMSECDCDGIARAAKLLADASYLHFIARGSATPAAKQAALSFMEGTRTACTAFTGGGFRHNGSFELVDKNHRCVFFIPGGRTFALLKKLAAEVAAKGSRAVIITDQKIPAPQKNCVVLRVPDCGEELFPIAAATTQELLLDALAARRGRRAGEFRYGQKVTTTE